MSAESLEKPTTSTNSQNEEQPTIAIEPPIVKTPIVESQTADETAPLLETSLSRKSSTKSNSGKSVF